MTRTKKERPDPICDACRERMKGNVPAHACDWCKEEQQSIHDVLGIIDRFMVPGEILLDPFAGTGTSLIAGQLLGMDVVGCEMDPKTHAIAVREMQQRPVDLTGFGIEDTAPDCERESVPEQKDTSRQAGIGDSVFESQPVKKPSLGVCAQGSCGDLDWEDQSCLAAGKPIADLDQCPKTIKKEPPKNCDTCKAGIFKGDTKISMDCPFYPEIQSGNIDAEGLREDTKKSECGHWSAPGSPEKIPNVWGYCVGTRNCKNISTEDGVCTKTGMKVREMTYCPAAYKDGPQPYIQHCCGTCGHHKGRKTFHESCPRLGELIFKGGTKSAKVLMEETAGGHPCLFWIPKGADRFGPCPEKNSMGGCMHGAYSCPHKTEEARAAVGCTYPIQPPHFAGDMPIMPKKKPKRSEADTPYFCQGRADSKTCTAKPMSPECTGPHSKDEKKPASRKSKKKEEEPES